jgi:hypothetical protein
MVRHGIDPDKNSNLHRSMVGLITEMKPAFLSTPSKMRAIVIIKWLNLCKCDWYRYTMSAKSGPGENSTQKTSAMDSSDGHSTIAHLNEKAECQKKEDATLSPATTVLDLEDYPDGGSRAWLIVFGVSGV